MHQFPPAETFIPTATITPVITSLTQTILNPKFPNTKKSNQFLLFIYINYYMYIIFSIKMYTVKLQNYIDSYK